MNYEQPVPCQEAPETWYSDDKRDIETAVAGCNRCWMKSGCLTSTLDYEELAQTTKVGVFGGLTPQQREKVRAA